MKISRWKWRCTCGAKMDIEADREEMFEPADRAFRSLHDESSGVGHRTTVFHQTAIARE